MADHEMLPQPIGGATAVAGVFGDPVAHSLSPVMHNAAYAALGMDRVYVPFHVRPPELLSALRGVVAMGLLGVNVTVPHKERAARYLKNNLSAEARLQAAVNCVINRGGRLVGDNTDAHGLELDLRELGAPVAGRSALLIGAGGGAAAALLALKRLGVRQVMIANRTRARALRLARRIQGVATAVTDLAALAEPSLVGEVAMVINATSIGLAGEPYPPLAYMAASPDCLFYDLIYRREPTSFLRPALQRGLRTADGIGMLLGQGVHAFELFNGVKAPVDVMRRALHTALGRS